MEITFLTILVVTLALISLMTGTAFKVIASIIKSFWFLIRLMAVVLFLLALMNGLDGCDFSGESGRQDKQQTVPVTNRSYGR